MFKKIFYISFLCREKRKLFYRNEPLHISLTESPIIYVYISKEFFISYENERTMKVKFKFKTRTCCEDYVIHVFSYSLINSYSFALYVDCVNIVILRIRQYINFAVLKPNNDQVIITANTSETQDRRK